MFEQPLPVLPFPTRLQIETTAKCNFRCGSCMHSFEGYDRRNLGHLSRDRFRHVLEEIPGLKEMELQGVGEPFLNPDAVDIIRLATLRQIHVHTFTNGSMLTPDLCDRIIASYLHSLTISVDGGTPETYAALRPGGKLEQTIDNVRHMIAAKRRAGTSHPYLNFMVVVSQRNVREIPLILDLARELSDIRNVSFTKLSFLLAPEWQDLRIPDQQAHELVQRYGNEWNGLGIQFYFADMSTEERRACWWPRQWVYISVEGYVTPCCNFHDPRQFNLGNIFMRPFVDIWHGEAYRQFRSRLEAGRFRRECATC
ncbi:MAG: radical SAM protein [Planctomycetota bacterium]